MSHAARRSGRSGRRPRGPTVQRRGRDRRACRRQRCAFDSPPAEQDRLRRRYTSNSEAYVEYLRGRAALVKYTPEATLGAIGRSRARCSAMPATRWRARAGHGVRGHVPALRAGRAKSSDGANERRRRPAPRWRSIRIWPKLTWRGRRSPASASSTGTPRSPPAAGRSC